MQRLLLGIARRVVRLHYRLGHLGGAVPAAGPVLLVANHPNGLVDPVVLACTTRRRVRFLGKAPLFDLPILGRVLRGLAVLPVYRPQDGDDPARNEATFAAAIAALRAGDLVCLFPEGVSHSDPSLRALKTGAARMALGAEAAGGFAVGVRILPVGLVYRSRRRFRSRVATWVGAPIEVRDLAASFRAEERAAVRDLTARIAQGIGEVTLQLDRWEDLPLLELAERIWREGEEERVVRLKRFADGVRALRARDPGRVEELALRIAAFGDRLAHLGVTVADLDVRYTVPNVLRFFLVNLRQLVLWLPAAAAGAAFWYLPYRAVGWIGRRHAPSPDTAATTFLLAAAVLFPAWLLLAALAAALAGGA
ncbi:MAG: 1-acyl-sn-glycerol-3-phosphate acyltransferase, partial [Planctomycetota bacterium]